MPGLARVGNLELVARQVVEGFITGRHRSPFHGFSAEYLDHRAYTPGDELATLDWQIVARTGYEPIDLGLQFKYPITRTNDGIVQTARYRFSAWRSVCRL